MQSIARHKRQNTRTCSQYNRIYYTRPECATGIKHSVRLFAGEAIITQYPNEIYHSVYALHIHIFAFQCH